MITNVYIHGDSESMIEQGINLGLSNSAAYNFGHSLYEIKLTLDVNTNGDTKIIAIDDMDIKQKKE